MFRRFIRFNSYHASDVIVDRKSKFQGRFVKINLEQDIPKVLSDLLLSSKSITKASHPHIIAWRVHRDSSIAQGFKDNGEKGAGMRLLDQVLVKHDLKDIVVIVTRWYGGSPIGSSRFRHINNAAMNSLRRGVR